MNIRSMKLRFAQKHVRAVIADTDGERGRDLEGDGATRVFAAARDLLAALQHRVMGAEIRSLSLNLGGRVLRLSLGNGSVDLGAGRGLRIDGTAFDDLLPAIQNVVRATLSEISQTAPWPT